ncbi:hypothetical protein MMC18_000876 [Xylographa bjoerkii]|nr:hypothetical protein [Xylographa bjoerkii]
MATLNLSTNGPSISKSYQSIVSSPPPSGNAAHSPTYGQWAVYSVSAPLVNAFQQDAGGKESILKVQSTGEGELVDLIEDFSDGRVQFAFVKVKDPNTSLSKYVLIGWCGEGVPERTKGYFTSHLAAVAKVLHGYHVQVTARSDRDLTPEGIVQKVSDASGSKYSAGTGAVVPADLPPAVASKPAFMPTRSGGASASFNPLDATGSRFSAPPNESVDDDGWGQDAPQVTRTQLEKVQSAYQPTKVNMRELSSQTPEISRTNTGNDATDRTDVVKGGYQPIGKVDIAALRRQAQESTSRQNDRPNVVKGSYEPVGKVDIAAIRAKAQPPSETATSPLGKISPAVTGTSTRSSEHDYAKPISERSAPFSSSERLTTLPKPKAANRFGSNVNSFAGTKAPTPSVYGLESKLSPGSPPVGASRTFADEGGKTPSQIWAERRARERGLSAAGEKPTSASFGVPTSPMPRQNSGGGEWKSGYSGKSWAAVQTTKTPQSSESLEQQRTGEDGIRGNEAPQSPAGGVGALLNKFKDAAPMGAAAPASERLAHSPPPPETLSKPIGNRGIPIPGLPTRPSQNAQEQEPEPPTTPTPPPQPPRSPTPPTPAAEGEEEEEEEEDSGSPIRVAMPVPRDEAPEVEDAREEQFSPPPAMPTRSLAQVASRKDDINDESSGYDAARGAGQAAAATTFGHEVVHESATDSHHIGKRAVVQYDYEKAEDNELELKEGEQVTNIDMVDDDWWMGENSRGETGLFPSNYVELTEGDGIIEHAAASESAAPSAAANISYPVSGPTATALYDYEAAEDNELSFPENAKITGLEFPDEDWWSGEYDGRSGLFPANYVQLDE